MGKLNFPEDTSLLKMFQDLSDRLDRLERSNPAEWVVYTPVWSTPGVQPAIGNGSIYGHWSRNGSMVEAYIRLILGSTSTVGTGGWIFTLPVDDIGLESCIKVDGRAIDISTGSRYQIVGERNTAGTFYANNAASPLARVTSAVPFAWTPADADVLVLNLSYRPAS